jgi:SAM-dependent methyltransferase
MPSLVDAQETRIPRDSDLPAALAGLHAGQVVLRLGPLDRHEALLAAEGVGPTGKVYDLVVPGQGPNRTAASPALDGTGAQVSMGGLVESLPSDGRRLPLPDNSVDHVFSCFAMNHAADKDRLIRETFRVLKPGGRLTMSEVVLRGSLSQDLRGATEYAFRGVKGALDEVDWCLRLARTGFSEISLEPWHVYRVHEIDRVLTDAGLDPHRYGPPLEGRIVHAHIYARRIRRFPPFPVTMSVIKFIMGI